jgi:uncharacterized membrane protein
MSPRTIFLSRLIGLYLVLISLAMLTHKQSTVESMTALMHNLPVLFVTAVIAMAAGLAMVLGTMSGREACFRSSSPSPGG